MRTECAFGELNALFAKSELNALFAPQVGKRVCPPGWQVYESGNRYRGTSLISYISPLKDRDSALGIFLL